MPARESREKREPKSKRMEEHEDHKEEGEAGGWVEVDGARVGGCSVVRSFRRRSTKRMEKRLGSWLGVRQALQEKGSVDESEVRERLGKAWRESKEVKIEERFQMMSGGAREEIQEGLVPLGQATNWKSGGGLVGLRGYIGIESSEIKHILKESTDTATDTVAVVIIELIET